MANSGAAAQAKATDTARPAGTATPQSDRRGGRNRGRFFARHWLSITSVVVGFALWQVIGEFAVGNSLFLATPSQALKAMYDLWGSGELPNDVLVSAEEFLIGYVLAGVAGILIGLLIASSKRLAAILSPWVSGFYATPTIALAPLLILWFGVGPASKIAVVVSLVIFPVIINTEAGVLATNPEFVEAARSFGCTNWQLFFKVSAPSALPYMLTGLRLGIGRGLIGVVVGELFGANAGLGYLINNSAQVFNMPALFAGLILFAAAGILLTAGFRVFERRTVHWHGRRDESR
jgi:NitT/TauT family transport system permease protein